MGIIAKSFIPVIKSAPVNMSGKFGYSNNLPNTQTDESYLRYYKQISWLRAAVSVIAQGVAQTEWILYRKKKDGDREEVTGQHELKNLLNRPNQFQSGHDLFYLHQVFDELLGRNFWVKQVDKGNKELWLLPPQFTAPISDPLEYISGYHYERGGYTKNFKTNEIIFFVDPDPLDPLTGAGRAQSVGIDIENQSFMSQWNRNFFYRGADPGTVITYPPEASITPDDLDRLNEQWGSMHRSYGRAHQTAILTQGGTVAKTSMGQREMDFSKLANYNRDSILGVFGVSYAIIGGTTDVNRANAEAQLYNFAKWVIVPRLIRIREKLNMFLCPDYGEDLELDYTDPTPEDQVANLAKATQMWTTGLSTRNESRELLGLDPDDTGAGDEYYKAPSPFGLTDVTDTEEEDKPKDEKPFGKEPVDEDEDKEDTEEEEDETAADGSPKVKSYFAKEQDAVDYWKAYVKTAEAYEPKVISSLRQMYSNQEQAALRALQSVVNRNDKLLDNVKAEKDYTEAITPHLMIVIQRAVDNGFNLIKPSTPHKDFPLLVNQNALTWLKTRIGWAAEQTSEQTAIMLQQALADGFDKGESINQIADRVKDVFVNCSDVRSQMIARTEILGASNQGNIIGYKEAGINKVEWLTARDERTCEICSPMNGDIENIEDAPPLPFSTHPACRCLWIPVID
jgi:HK97 family phage portal protein